MNGKIYVYFLKVPTLEEILDYAAFLIKESWKKGKLLEFIGTYNFMREIGEYIYSYYRRQMENIIYKLKIGNEKIAVISPYLSRDLKSILIIKYDKNSPDSEIIETENIRLDELDNITQDLLKKGYAIVIQSPRNAIGYLNFTEKAYKAVGLFYTSFFFILTEVLNDVLKEMGISEKITREGKYIKTINEIVPIMYSLVSAIYRDNTLNTFLHYGIKNIVLMGMESLEKETEPSDQIIKRIVRIYKEGIYKNTINEKEIKKIKEFLESYGKVFEKIIDLAKGMPIINVY